MCDFFFMRVWTQKVIEIENQRQDVGCARMKGREGSELWNEGLSWLEHR